jgi:hypothetical protein
MDRGKLGERKSRFPEDYVNNVINEQTYTNSFCLRITCGFSNRPPILGQQIGEVRL